jgi:hypothetical protein
MRAESDRKIHISSGESVKIKVRGPGGRLTLLGAKHAPSKELSIAAGPQQKLIRIRAESEIIDALTVSSTAGEHWETTIFPGSNLIDFVVEPDPDEWYCENDTGSSPHRVSKGDSKCKICGGRLMHRSK